MDGPVQREYQTRRVFLSQSGVSSIQAGQIIKLRFNEEHLGTITGITLIPIGQTAIDLTGAYAVVQKPTGPDGELEQSGRFSFKSEKSGVSGQLIRLNSSSEAMSGPGSIHLLEFGFDTAGLSDNEAGSVNRPVSLSYSYYDSTGRLLSRSIDDIRPFIQNKTHSFLTGETTWVRLLAEDVQVNAEIMMMVLEGREMEADLAENGKIAVEKFESHEPGYYDAILMDMRMPEMDGLEATKTIRAMDRPDAKTIPIIALTANAFDEDVQRSMQAGLNAHLSKPVQPEVLYETLENLIED